MTDTADIDLELKNVNKWFGDLHAVRDVSLDVGRGEFVSLLGPSGCGKTTTLSMIAGFQALSSGTIVLGGRRIDHLPPERRNTGMVFQNYALFPHMDVETNVGFGLRMRGINAAERASRVKRALEMVEMTGYGLRKPSQLSGGQQQRIALARCLVIEPSMLLLDEPFGALDRQLRDNMQVELKLLQQRLGITTVFVTHDQDEALSMSDRVAVMRDGVVEQIGSPAEIYEHPATEFVAGFIGNSNQFDGRVSGTEGDRLVINTDAGVLRTALPKDRTLTKGTAVTVMVRPEKVRIVTAQDDAENRINATVRQVVYHGVSTQIHLSRSDGSIFHVYEPNNASAPRHLASGTEVQAGWNALESRLFIDSAYCR